MCKEAYIPVFGHDEALKRAASQFTEACVLLERLQKIGRDAATGGKNETV